MLPLSPIAPEDPYHYEEVIVNFGVTAQLETEYDHDVSDPIGSFVDQVKDLKGQQTPELVDIPDSKS